ncbi:hypothetical protein GmRootA79_46930 [Acidovorax sp. A79]
MLKSPTAFVPSDLHDRWSPAQADIDINRIHYLTMSADANQKPPFDLKVVQAAMALTSPPPALLPTLGAIWDEAVEQLKRTEEKHAPRLQKVWGDKSPTEKDFSVLKRAALAKSKESLNLDAYQVLEYAYFRALALVQRIHDAFYDLHPPNAPLHNEEPDEALMKRLLTADNLKEKAFLDRVVSPFFALQLEAAFLRKHLEIPKGVPLALAVRQDRGSKGGRGANRGMEAVQEVVIRCLESACKGKMYQSPTALGHAYPAEIETVLATHRQELHERQKRGEKVPSSYAFGITAEGVIRNLPRWAKENPLFGERLAKLCKLKA